MSLQPKPEPGSPPSSTSTNPNYFEQETIPDLFKVLRGTGNFDTYVTIERVLVARDKGLRAEIQQLQKKFEAEKLQLQEKLQMEVLSRIHAEEEFRKREELCEKGKLVQESYETLLKNVKRTDFADKNTIKELKKENNELECEVKNLKEKCVDDGNKIDVLRRKNAELEYEVLELRKMKEKFVEDGYQFGLLRKEVVELENKVLELKKLNEKLVEDNIGFDELRNKVRVLEGDKNALAVDLKIQIGELEERVKNHLTTITELREGNEKLADEKREVDILYKLLCAKFRDLQVRVSTLEDHAKRWMNDDASDDGNDEGEPLMNVDVADGGNSEGGPPADPVTDFEDNFEEYDTLEAAPLPRIEDAPHSLGVGASTQPQNIVGNDAQGASSAGGRVELVNGIEVINLVDEDDDDDRSIPPGVHGKAAIYDIVVKDEYPSSSGAAQQNSKLANTVVDTVKRKFPFPDIETSSDDSSSDDSSFYDSLPIRSVVSQGKKTKM